MIEHQSTPGADPDDTVRFDEALIHAASTESSPANPHVDALSQTIGPRPPGSQAERDAADYVVSVLADAGLPAVQLTSRIPRFASLPDLAFALTALIAMLVTLLLPALGILVLAGVLGLMLAAAYGYVDIHSRRPAIDSVDVLTIVPPRQAEVRRLIITSTLDSGKVGLLSRRHLAHGYAWIHSLIAASVVLALLIGVIVLVDAEDTLRPLLVLPALGVIAALALLAERVQSRQSSPGAITNASGVAAMVEVAATTRRDPPQWLEVWILGVGGSTVPGGGMATFLEKNRFDPDTTYFVHIQSPGAGSPVVPTATGAGLRPAPATPLLAWIFDSVRPDSDPTAPAALKRLSTDTLARATHQAGYQSVVVAGTDERGRIPFLDDPEDLPYQMREAGISETVELIVAAIGALDREVAARAMLARSTASIQDTSKQPAIPQGLPTEGE